MEASVHRRSPRIRVARPITLLISLALVALSLVAATAGTGSASSTSELSECLGALNRVRVGAGGQGSDPNSLSAGEAAASEVDPSDNDEAKAALHRGGSDTTLLP
jgi:hypothetical protein